MQFPVRFTMPTKSKTFLTFHPHRGRQVQYFLSLFLSISIPHYAGGLKRYQSAGIRSMSIHKCRGILFNAWLRGTILILESISLASVNTELPSGRRIIAIDPSKGVQLTGESEFYDGAIGFNYCGAVSFSRIRTISVFASRFQ